MIKFEGLLRMNSYEMLLSMREDRTGLSEVKSIEMSDPTGSHKWPATYLPIKASECELSLHMFTQLLHLLPSTLELSVLDRY